MGNWRKRYTSEHLEAADIPEGKEITIKILSIGSTVVEGDKGKESKGLWQFEPSKAFGAICPKRTFVPARTVGHCMAAMFGPDDDAWVGKRVTLRAEQINADTEAVRCVGSPDFAMQSKTIRLRGAPGQGKINVTLRNTAPKPKPQPASGSVDSTDLRDEPPPVGDVP